tara:strand:- start:31 stop:1599 length:1569 start_codon:yes stop_codon:yes gene_type:complete
LLKIIIFFYSIIDLKLIQIIYGVKYHLFSHKIKKRTNLKCYLNKKKGEIFFINSSDKILNNKNFIILSQKVKINDNWLINSDSLLKYNFFYFNFINNENKNKNYIFNFIKNFFKISFDIKGFWDPYPTSIRLINLIKFLSKNDINDSELNEIILLHYINIKNNLEYRLLGNHLLTNLVAINIFFSVYKFDNKKKDYYQKKLLSEINNQFNENYEHIELTPMYQGILIEQLLDLQNFNKSYKNKTLNFKYLICNMLHAYNNYHTSENEIFFFNDTNNNSPKAKALIEYFNRVFKKKYKLKNILSKNFWNLKNKNISIMTKCCGPNPIFNPGHSHADNLSFEMAFKDQKIFVNPGVYSYSGINRLKSRQTKNHNTLVLGGDNSSQIWSNFRIGKKAQTTVEKKNKKLICFSHDGYSSFFKKIIHKRKIDIINKNIFIIEDEVSNTKKSSYINLNFDPSIKNLKITGNVIKFRKKNIYGKIILQGQKFKVYKNLFFERFFKKKNMSSLLINTKLSKSMLRIEING